MKMVNKTILCLNWAYLFLSVYTERDISSILIDDNKVKNY